MSSLVILFLCIASIISRVSVDFANQEGLVFLMAVINTVALIIVVVNLFKKTLDVLNVKISKMTKPNLSFNMKKQVDKKRNFYVFLIFLLCVFYIWLWKNSLMNDLISIVSLTLSITDDDISCFFANRIFNKK